MSYTLTGLIDYASAANDVYLKQWVRQGYECFRNIGLPRIGMMVEVRNKTCRVIYVRIPAWVNRRAVTCETDGKRRPFSWAGNFLILNGLATTDLITLRFPMVETVETYYLLTREVGARWWERTDDLPRYVMHMKGNTCVKVEFPNREKFTRLEPMYPVFQREHYRANRAPMKTVTRFVHARVIDWGM